MKKFLVLLGAILITFTSAVFMTSCGDESGDSKPSESTPTSKPAYGDDIEF